MCRKANHEDGNSMNKVQETLIEWKAHANMKRGPDQKQAPQPIGLHSSTAKRKQELADISLNIKGLIFFPSQSDSSILNQ